MKFLEVFVLIFGIFAVCFVGIWLGIGIGLQACVNHGDKGFRHNLFEESFLCEVKK